MLMNHNAPAKTDKSIYLRALELTDLDSMVDWHNDQTLYELLGGNFRWVSRAAEEEWLRRHSAYSLTEVNLAICMSDSKEHIGNLYLRGIDWINRHAELHIFIGAEGYRSKGYGKEALRLVLSHAFDDLGLRRIFLHVLASNDRARRLYRKCGFVEEGCLRRHALKSGEFQDVILMGILCEDWQAAGKYE
jgi:RimJ/RimL family protein N-acetyltransferase